MDTRQFTARTLLKVSTEWGMPDTVVPTVGRLREVLDEWFAGPTPEEAATLDQVTSSAHDDKGLGIVITEHDPLDRDTVTDQEFAEWICRGWLAEGKAWENGQVTVWLASRPTWDPDEEAWPWPGGTCKVAAVHATTFQGAYRPTSSWSELRDRISAATADELAELEEIERARALQHDREQPVRDAVARTAAAQTEILAAERSRDAHLAQLLTSSDPITRERAAEISGLDLATITDLHERALAKDPTRERVLDFPARCRGS